MQDEQVANNGLICFTNCLLPLEDGSLVKQDLWIDERRGVIVNAQRAFYLRRERPEKIIDLEGNILSPGFLDIQINGAFGHDFSIFDGDEAAYKAGMTKVGQGLVETGVTSLVPTIITQEESLYPSLLSLLQPFTPPGGAHLLGWHAEGPYLQSSKRGAHAIPHLREARGGFSNFEKIYGETNLAVKEDWELACGVAPDSATVRLITAAPEVDGVMDAIDELTKRGITMSIGHSTATTEVATKAVKHGARLITHLFNAMPQLHHRDPSIIGLLGASPHISPRNANNVPSPNKPRRPVPVRTFSRGEMHLDKGEVADMEIERPFYSIIVDGVHLHPNSVRLAYTAHQDGCILVTDAMSMLAPHLTDGIHEWRDGKRLIKDGLKLYIEGTDTLAGSVVTIDECVRNFSRFTGCSLGEAIKCATYNPARCLGIENKKGTLRPDADADLVVLDLQGRVVSTWVLGKKVWSRDR